MTFMFVGVVDKVIIKILRMVKQMDKQRFFGTRHSLSANINGFRFMNVSRYLDLLDTNEAD